jgi:hypothetical protein
MAKEAGVNERLEKRLDLIIHLLCLLVDQNKVPSITDQIAILASHGLAPAEIGRIVGREANYVSASLKNKKRGKNNAI